MRKFLLTPVFLISMAASSLAHGAAPSSLGEDEISLKDGGMVRGTVIEVEPKKQATIVVKGKERVIPWAKIDKVERGKYKEKAPARPAAPPSRDEPEDEKSTELTAPEAGAPLIHIEANYPKAELVRIDRSKLVVVGPRGIATCGDPRGSPPCAARRREGPHSHCGSGSSAIGNMRTSRTKAW
jgi:hypothetical protein